jgi:hypothetical protein
LSAAPMLIVTSWSGPDDDYTINTYDSDGNEGDLLVNTIGSYNGTNLINIHNDENWPLTRPSAHTIADEVGAGAALQCERAY